ncbi:hypothetical protein [Mycolicibacterium lutetiense]|jgi:hypothetical protein
MRIRQIYLTAMLAAVPAAVAAALAATPMASPANVQLSAHPAVQNVPLDPRCDLDLQGNCNVPGIPGNINVNPPNINVNPPNINVNPPNVNLPGPRR